MITRWTAAAHSFRRWFSRSEWIVRLWRLPKASRRDSQRGLVLLQIDGLSRSQLEAALAKRRVPFLQSLLLHEHYELNTLYSGVPSTTPAVQGELFYGKQGAVPSFEFRDKATHSLVRMYFPATAARVERELSKTSPGLLAGGSAYSHIYSGGAAEAHFCAATVGWGGVFELLNPISIAAMLLLHIWGIVRTVGLMFVEFVLALVDCCRGVVSGKDLFKELGMIPTRVAVVILMRELIVMGATIDVARGLRVVSANLLGYDEQAHRRGPSSPYAHWTLKGIDNTICRIWRAAKRSSRREYDIWIYSDHGQEETIPFEKAMGRSVTAAIEDVLDHWRIRTGALVQHATVSMAEGHGIQGQRAGWLGRGRLMTLLRWLTWGEWTDPVSSVAIAAVGPLGHLYLDWPIGQGEFELLARDLVRKAKVPLVLRREAGGTVVAYNASGEFLLQQNAAAVLGDKHPFLQEAADDLAHLCHHRDAGTLVLSGWRPSGMPVSFPQENGAHGGPGREETCAFALLPTDAPVVRSASKHLRPLDIRMAALQELSDRQYVKPAKTTAKPETLRVMTYNIHYCIGMDRNLSPQRIARVIRQCDADVIALQELDIAHRRSGKCDQVDELARLLKMDCHFHPSWTVEDTQHGIAVLSRLPVSLVHADALPICDRSVKLEHRGAMWVRIDVAGTILNLINTHLDVSPGQQRVQVDDLLGTRWLAHPDCGEPLILCGDFNFGPRSELYRKLCARLSDAQSVADNHQPLATWFGSRPMRRIDHILLSANLGIESVYVARSQLARMASDHLPLVVDVSLTRESIYASSATAPCRTARKS